jgi:hypothetical protein
LPNLAVLFRHNSTNFKILTSEKVKEWVWHIYQVIGSRCLKQCSRNCSWGGASWFINYFLWGYECNHKITHNYFTFLSNKLWRHMWEWVCLTALQPRRYRKRIVWFILDHFTGEELLPAPTSFEDSQGRCGCGGGWKNHIHCQNWTPYLPIGKEQVVPCSLFYLNDDSPLSSVEIKNRGAIRPLPHISSGHNA